MGVNVPQTIWQPTSGNGEMSIGSEEPLETVSGLELVTVSGDNIVTTESVFTQIPDTIWTEDDSE